MDVIKDTEVLRYAPTAKTTGDEVPEMVPRSFVIENTGYGLIRVMNEQTPIAIGNCYNLQTHLSRGTKP